MKMTFLVQILVGLALPSPASFAAGQPASPAELPEIDIPFTRHVLPNGLTLIVHEDHKAPIVAVNIWYHVGSKDEKAGRTGFAHLFEHLMFNGSENYDDEFFRPLQPAGATSMNGTTWYDRTDYFQTVPTPALDLTLWLESDRMGHLLGAIDQEKLDEQRGVVQNEKREREGQPYGRAGELIAANSYPAGHPYSWTAIGSMEDLNAASLEDVKEWFRTWYGAANAVLVIAGDVRFEEVKSRVEHYFGDIPGGPVLSRHRSWTAKMSGEKRLMMEDRVAQAQIHKTWNIPGITSRDAALLEIAGYSLAGTRNGRLHKRLVYDEQLATEVNAGAVAYEIAGQFSISATVKPGADVRRVEQIVDEELAQFLREGPTRKELDDFNTTNYAGLAHTLERIGGGGKSSILAESQVYGGSPDFYKEGLRWKRRATPADVKAAAVRWLSDGVLVLEVQPAPEHLAAKSGADRSKLPALGEPPDLKLPALERATLSNGLKIAVAERHSAPIVQLQLLVDAGTAADSQAGTGTAGVAAAMMSQGTKTRSALQIAARAEELGAMIGGTAALDTSTFGVHVLSPRLDESLELFSDILLNPTFPAQELARQKSQLLAAIQRSRTTPEGIVSRLMPKLLFGEGHAYSSSVPTEETVDAMTAEGLAAFHKRWMRPDNATLLIVGDTSLGQIKPLLEKYLGAWRAPAEPLPTKNLAAVALPSGPRVFLVNQTGAQQSLIHAGHVGPIRSAADFVPLKAANMVLGGGFLSRLNLNLREDKHWSYGAGSVLRESKGPGSIRAIVSVQTDKTAEGVQEVLKELRELSGTRKPEPAEIEVAKNSMVVGLPANVETIMGVSGFYESILTYQLPQTYWNDYVSQVRALTDAEVQAAAAKHIRPQALTWFIVGDLSRIEDGVRKLDLGEVRVLDASGGVVR